MKFLIGDLVKLKRDNASFAPYKAGTIFKITTTQCPDIYHYRATAVPDDGAGNWTFAEHELELFVCVSGTMIVADKHIMYPRRGYVCYGIDTAENPTIKKCECGASAVGVDKHSDYCPLYE